MATVNLTKDNFEDTLNNNEIMLIDFWASWCGPCKAFGPIYEKVSEKYEDVVFGKVNTEEQQELAGSFGVRAIPTTAVFRDQLLVYLQPGMLPEPALEELVDKVKELDMDKIRATIAEQEAKEAAEAAE